MQKLQLKRPSCIYHTRPLFRGHSGNQMGFYQTDRRVNVMPLGDKCQEQIQVKSENNSYAVFSLFLNTLAHTQ